MMWTPEYQKDRFSPASLLSDWSDPVNGHYHSRSDEGLPDTDTEDAPSTEFRKDRFGLKVINDDNFGFSRRQNGMPQVVKETRPGTSFSQQAFKCRQLPCRTFISTGSCPYGDRCVFLHDPQIESKPVYIKTKRKSKEDTAVDTFFWPTMSLNSVMGKVDQKKLPHISQPYIVPAPSSYNQAISNNDYAVFSMWEHFLDFCKSDSLSIVTFPRSVPRLNPYNLTNPYTGKKRLPIFVRLSQTSSF